MHWKGWGKMKLFLFPVQNIGRVSWCCIYSRFCRMYEFHFRFAWNPDSVVLLLVFTTFIGQRMLSSCTKWPKSMSQGRGVKEREQAFSIVDTMGFALLWQLLQASIKRGSGTSSIGRVEWASHTSPPHSFAQAEASNCMHSLSHVPSLGWHSRAVTIELRRGDSVTQKLLLLWLVFESSRRRTSL